MDHSRAIGERPCILVDQAHYGFVKSTMLEYPGKSANSPALASAPASDPMLGPKRLLHWATFGHVSPRLWVCMRAPGEPW